MKPNTGGPRPFGASLPRAGPRSPRSPVSYPTPAQQQQWSQPAPPPVNSYNNSYASNTLPRQNVPGTLYVNKDQFFFLSHSSLIDKIFRLKEKIVFE